ncbi:hypothetical protein F5887DRAFT_1099644 [Amanita rubescens]|nr:hypothetical protein F5887DRAFT_1099644 [Amanita rubescens]
MSSIAAWAAAVHPGSPAPPSPSFIQPTPVDLTTHGYTPIFINIPYTRSPPRALPTSPKQQQQSTLRRLFCPLSKSVTGAGASSKKRKYAHVPPPLSLANEIALMQFVNGGSINANGKRAMKARESQAGVGVIYKDENGHIWWDEDEKYEYAQGQDVDEGLSSCREFPSQQRSAPLATDTASTLVSHLGERDIVKLAEETTYPVVPGLSVLTVPSRARKSADGAVEHLRQPEFLVDVAPFGTRLANAASPRPKDKAKRRPAPLKILSPVSSFKKPSNPALPSAGLGSAEEPMPLPRVQILPSHVDHESGWNQWPRLDLRTIFRAGMSNE